jgi:hypothetical protein
MRPSNRTTTTGVTLCHKKVGGPSSKGSTALDDFPYLQMEAESASERQYYIARRYKSPKKEDPSIKLCISILEQVPVAARSKA